MASGLRMVAFVGLLLAVSSPIVTVWMAERMFWLERRINHLEDQVYGANSPRAASARSDPSESQESQEACEAEWTPLEAERE